MEESTAVMQEQRMNLLVTIWRKRKILLITTAAAFVVSSGNCVFNDPDLPFHSHRFPCRHKHRFFLRATKCQSVINGLRGRRTSRTIDSNFAII